MNTAWTEPKYPGDDVRIALLIRGDEIGDVRIQDYGEGVNNRYNRYRVGQFLPGVEERSPGDTPKVSPERGAYCATPGEANSTFLEYVRLARADGWQDYSREIGKTV